MAILYYGGGSCTIEGTNINAVEITYRGAIEIDSKLEGNYIIDANSSKIIIAPFGNVQPLNELFEYIGEFKILSVKSVNEQGEKESTTIHRVMDYSELLNTNAEDLTTKSEDLKVTYMHDRKIRKTAILPKSLKGGKV